MALPPVGLRHSSSLVSRSRLDVRSARRKCFSSSRIYENRPIPDRFKILNRPNLEFLYNFLKDLA